MLLITAIEATMTVSALYNVPPVGVYSTLAARWFNCSFILKETQAPEGGGMAGVGAWSVSQLVFKVDFIGPDGVADAQMKGKWVTGSVMKDMITPRGCSAKPKPKFAYDHTVLSGPSFWHSGVLSQMSQAP